jgi:hypothetical protein
MRDMCSWCHSENPQDQQYCSTCGHEAHAARIKCQCSRCLREHNRMIVTAFAVKKDADIKPSSIPTRLIGALWIAHLRRSIRPGTHGPELEQLKRTFYAAAFVTYQVLLASADLSDDDAKRLWDSLEAEFDKFYAQNKE